MYAQVEKPKEKKSQSVANAVAQKYSGGAFTFQFVDNRPEAFQQRKLQEMANSFSAQQQPIQKKENKTGLPDNLKSGIENLSGYSMDDVKVNYNSDKPAQLHAHAYAQGTDIHIASGQEKHLPHEAWHVVQQKQGRVKPTVQMKGEILVNDDEGLEAEADFMGAKVAAWHIPSLLFKKQATQAENNYQRMPISGIGGKEPLNFPSSVQQAHSGSTTTQCKYISSAGFELEWKGIGVMKKYDQDEELNNEDFGKHEDIKHYAGGNYTLEIDARSPEIVSKPATSKADLLNYLDASIVTLNEIWTLVKDGGDLKTHGFPNTTYAWESGLGGTAKPQLTLGIKKAGLKDFATDALKEEGIAYEHVKAGKNDDTFKNITAPRINSIVRTKFKNRWQDKLAEICPIAVGKMESSSPEAVGLVLMSVLSTIFASRTQDKSNENEYYKARFSILPRIALSGLYDQLENGKQKEVKELLQLIKDTWTITGLVEEIQTYEKDENKVVDVKKELQSIYDPDARKDKTMKNYGNAAKKVDLISSDTVASSSDVGEAVGAYSPDEQESLRGLSGLFELRSMPYVDISNKDSVKKVVSKTIESYGDMD